MLELACFKFGPLTEQAGQQSWRDCLRAHPRSLDSWRGIYNEPSEHDADHGETDEGDSGSRVALEVPGETPTAADLGEGALDDPALGQHLEAVGVLTS